MKTNVITNERNEKWDSFIPAFTVGTIVVLFMQLTDFFPSMIENLMQFVGSIFILSGILNLSDWYNNVTDPFTPEEWRLIGKITAIREGSSKFSSKMDSYNALDTLQEGCLYTSVSALPLKNHFILFDVNGRIFSFPWIATKQNYWENILNPRKNFHGSKGVAF